eukprot:12354243-Alexandrium_andersonii.AAC.1
MAEKAKGWKLEPCTAVGLASFFTPIARASLQKKPAAAIAGAASEAETEVQEVAPVSSSAEVLAEDAELFGSGAEETEKEMEEDEEEEEEREGEQESSVDVW